MMMLLIGAILLAHRELSLSEKSMDLIDSQSIGQNLKIDEK